MLPRLLLAASSIIDLGWIALILHVMDLRNFLPGIVQYRPIRVKQVSEDIDIQLFVLYEASFLDEVADVVYFDIIYFGCQTHFNQKAVDIISSDAYQASLVIN